MFLQNKSVRAFLLKPLDLVVRALNSPSTQLIPSIQPPNQTVTMQKAQEVLSKATGGAIGSLLPTAKLGKNGPQVTRMGYGGMGLVTFPQRQG